MAKKKYTPLSADEARDKMVGVKLTTSEFEDVAKICNNIGVTKSRFFRYLYKEYKKNVS